MISINAVLFGVLATLFVEMAAIIITCVIAPRVHSGHRAKPVNPTRKNNNTMEVKNNG